MKQLVLALTALAIFASCNKTATTDNQQLASSSSLQYSEAVLDPVKITVADADEIIDDWQDYVDDNLDAAMMNSLYFMMDKDILDDILSDASIEDLVIYPALKADNTITLVYVGAKEDGNGDMEDQIFTLPPDATEYVYDNVFPCPTCDDRADINTDALATKISDAKMSVADATDIVEDWEDYVDNNLPAAMMNSLYFIVDADVIREVLSDADVLALRVYPALKADNTMTLVYTGVEDDGNGDLINTTYTFGGGSTEHYLDNVFPCPTCDTRVSFLD